MFENTRARRTSLNRSKDFESWPEAIEAVHAGFREHSSGMAQAKTVDELAGVYAPSIRA